MLLSAGDGHAGAELLAARQDAAGREALPAAGCRPVNVSTLPWMLWRSVLLCCR